MAHKKKNSSRNIDRNLFGDPAGDYIEGKALEAIANFIDNVDYDTETAFELCHLIEKGMSAERTAPAFKPIINKFPKKKIAYKKKQDKKYKANMAAMKAFEEEMRKQGLTLEDFMPDEDGQVKVDFSSQERLEEFKGAMGTLNAIREEGKRIQKGLDYEAVYKDDEFEYVAAREEDWKYLGELFRAEADKRLKAKDAEDFIYKNLDGYIDSLSIKGVEKGLVKLGFYSVDVPWFNSFQNMLGGNTLQGTLSVFARMLNTDLDVVNQLTDTKSSIAQKSLMTFGMETTKEGTGKEVFYMNMAIIRAITNHKNRTVDDVRADVLGEVEKANFGWKENFSYLGDAGRLACDDIKRGLDSGVEGINTIFFGSSGVGKTESAKALAAYLGADLYTIGGQKDKNLTSMELLQKLVIMQNMLEGTNSIILFDEISDILPGSATVNGDAKTVAMGASGSDASKEYLHNILETNKVPTIYTDNDIWKFHPSIIQRIGSSVSFALPPVSEQKKMWKYISAQKKKNNKGQFSLSPADCAHLAKNYNVPPRVMKQVLDRSSSLKDVEVSIIEAAKRITQNSNTFDRANRLPKIYNPDFINAKVDGRDLSAVELSKALVKKNPSSAFAMCIYGPSGSGKSAYAVDLANSMGKEAVQIPSAMLAGAPYTKAKADLEKAAYSVPDNTMLVIEDDEKIASSVADTNNVIASLNEMLENKIGNTLSEVNIPVVLITNKLGKSGVKPEISNNFNYVVNFGYLENGSVEKSYKAVFNKRSVPTSLKDVNNVTIGDVMTVHKKLQAEVMPVKPAGIVDMIKKEVAMRKSTVKKPIRFI